MESSPKDMPLSDALTFYRVEHFAARTFAERTRRDDALDIEDLIAYLTKQAKVTSVAVTQFARGNPLEEDPACERQAAATLLHPGEHMQLRQCHRFHGFAIQEQWAKAGSKNKRLRAVRDERL